MRGMGRLDWGHLGVKFLRVGGGHRTGGGGWAGVVWDSQASLRWTDPRDNIHTAEQ